MSDTDDGFDEEAVRRELREKYEDDDRGETERMSELLLQGATMTNQHCDHCGTPIFRYEGQAFCPNCQHEAEQQAAAEQAQAAEQAEGGEQAQAGQAPQDSQSQSASQQRQAGGQQQRAERAGASDHQSTPAQSEAAPSTGGGDAARGRPATPQSARAPSQSEGQTAAPSSEAADALESSISALARRAAGSDDPRTAREYLEAAREAAEALAALRRNA